MSVDTTVRLPGLALKNPILTASGTFGYGLEFTPFGDLRDLGGIVVKGLSLAPRQGNPMLASSVLKIRFRAFRRASPHPATFTQGLVPAAPHKENRPGPVRPTSCAPRL